MAKEKEILQERIYLRTATGEEKIIDKPMINAFSLYDIPGSCSYGDGRIIMVVSSICKEFAALEKAMLKKQTNK